MANTSWSNGDLEQKIPGNQTDKPTLEVVNTDADRLFDTSLEVTEAKGKVKEKAWELLAGLDFEEKKELPKISIKMQKYIDKHNILEQNIPEFISLIKQLGEFIFSKKLESKGKKLKLEIEELLINEDVLRDLVRKLVNIENSEEKKVNSQLILTIIEIIKHELTSIIVEMLDYESRLVGQYRRNKDELLERLKNSSNINVWWNKTSNDIASLTKEELIEIFSCTENANWLDFSSYDLDLLNEDQLEAIFSNFNKKKTVDLSGAIYALWKAKWEIIFSNMEECETLIFWMNNVTDEILELIAKYLKKLKSIDFTMSELMPKQIEFVKKEFPNAEICHDWLDEGIDLDFEGK